MISKLPPPNVAQLRGLTINLPATASVVVYLNGVDVPYTASIAGDPPELRIEVNAVPERPIKLKADKGF